MESLKKFAIEYEKLNINDKEILRIFRLEVLAESEFWLRIINPTTEKGERPLGLIIRSLRDFNHFLPKVLELFKQDYADEIIDSHNRHSEIFKGKDILTIFYQKKIITSLTHFALVK